MRHFASPFFYRLVLLPDQSSAHRHGPSAGFLALRSVSALVLTCFFIQGLFRVLTIVKVIIFSVFKVAENADVVQIR